MAQSRHSPQRHTPFWTRRMVEWSVVGVLVLVVVWVLAVQTQRVQALAEFAAAQNTLAALRTAYVLQHAAQAVQTSRAAPLSMGDPLALLQRRPDNDAGQLPRAQAQDIAPGHWAFDPDCRCLGYRLRHAQWLQAPQPTDVVWFQLQVQSSGIITLQALQPYQWHGQSFY